MGEAMIDTEMITKPLLPLRGLLVLPGMMVNVDVGREKSMAAVRAVMEGEKKIILTAQKDVNINDVTTADLFGWGVLAEVKQQLQLPSGAMRIWWRAWLEFSSAKSPRYIKMIATFS